MKWMLDKSRPICPQICEELCVAIASGEFKAGERLLSVREVALAAGVNPNTVQKSFEDLERQGIIYSVRCSGWFVGENVQLAAGTVTELRRTKTEEYLAAMKRLGLDEREAVEYLNENYGG